MLYRLRSKTVHDERKTMMGNTEGNDNSTPAITIDLDEAGNPKWHEGNRPVTSGKYSRILELIETAQRTDDIIIGIEPTNMMPFMSAVQRGTARMLTGPHAGREFLTYSPDSLVAAMKRSQQWVPDDTDRTSLSRAMSGSSYDQLDDWTRDRLTREGITSAQYRSLMKPLNPEIIEPFWQAIDAIVIQARIVAEDPNFIAGLPSQVGYRLTVRRARQNPSEKIRRAMMHLDVALALAQADSSAAPASKMVTESLTKAAQALGLKFSEIQK
jgi:hypothetical protein